MFSLIKIEGNPPAWLALTVMAINLTVGLFIWIPLAYTVFSFWF